MTCGKVRYESRKDAKAARKRLNKDFSHLYAKLVNTYFCADCSGWHNTHMEKKMYKKLKRKGKIK